MSEQAKYLSVFSSQMKLKAWPKHKFLVSYLEVVLGGIHQLRWQIFGYFWPLTYLSYTNVDILVITQPLFTKTDISKMTTPYQENRSV